MPKGMVEHSHPPKGGTGKAGLIRDPALNGGARREARADFADFLADLIAFADNR